MAATEQKPVSDVPGGNRGSINYGLNPLRGKRGFSRGNFPSEVLPERLLANPCLLLRGNVGDEKEDLTGAMGWLGRSPFGAFKWGNQPDFQLLLEREFEAL